MQIYAKASLDSEQIDVKMNIGCDGIEIQLLDELVNGSLGNYHKAEDVFKLDTFTKYPIRAVHAPLLSHFGHTEVNLENFVDKDLLLFDQVFYIANYFGKIQQRPIVVVIHTETDYLTLTLINNVWQQVVTALGSLLLKYPYTEVVIENVAPLRDSNTDNIHLCNNIKFDNIQMAMKLREELNTDRIGTCIDTCHAMLSEKYMKALFREMGTHDEDYSLDAFFRENAKCVKLIHLCDYELDGYTKGTHGTRFCEKNKDKLKDIVDLYYKYNLDCPVTLEIGETDYYISDGYADSYRTLQEVLGEICFPN